MGTFSSHPFGNDVALDLCDLLAELGEADKVEHLTNIFANSLSPDPAERVWPAEVIAGAALVALVLPGGGSVVSTVETDLDLDSEAEADEEWYSALIRQPSGNLVTLARTALGNVTSPSSEWYSNWLNDGVRAEALGWIERIYRVLESAESQFS